MDVTKAPGFILAATTSFVVAMDQITKSIVRHELNVCSSPPVALCDRRSIAGPLGLLRTENGDGAFGLLAGEAIGPVLVVLLGFLLGWVARLSKTRSFGLGAGLVLGGLLANLADRASFGVVTDFIDLRWGLADQGLVLNPADIALAGGGLILAILLYRDAARFDRVAMPDPAESR